LNAPVQVLVADDDDDIRDTLRLLLEDAGYFLVEAGDGATTLDQLRGAAQPMVVLLDLVMPQPDGEAILRAVADDAALAGRHAYIVLTAGSDRLVETVEPLRSRLSLQIVRKPFDIDDVLDGVAEAARHMAAPA
jgi:CheY-like chemotaxis protein